MQREIWGIFSDVSFIDVQGEELKWPPLTEILNFKIITIIYRFFTYISQYFQICCVQKIKHFTRNICILSTFPTLRLCCPVGRTTLPILCISVLVYSERMQIKAGNSTVLCVSVEAVPVDDKLIAGFTGSSLEHQRQ